MQKFILKEGWFTTEFLPPGFLIKQMKSERSFDSMSPTFEQYRTMRVLFAHLMQDFGDEVASRFEDNYKSLQTEPVNVRNLPPLIQE
jgi:hypothetical protein